MFFSVADAQIGAPNCRFLALTSLERDFGHTCTPTLPATGLKSARAISLSVFRGLACFSHRI